MSYTPRRLAALNAFINDPGSIDKPFQLLLELTQATEEIERLQVEVKQLKEALAIVLKGDKQYQQ